LVIVQTCYKKSKQSAFTIIPLWIVESMVT
jgi:hypothetical protein